MKKKISLSVIIGSLDSGGSERHLLEVMPLLQKNYEISISIFTISHLGVLFNVMQERGVSVYSGLQARNYQLFKPLVFFLNSLWLYAHLVKSKPDIVHFFLPQAYIIGAIVASLLPRRPALLMSRRSLNYYQDKHRIMRWTERLLHSRMALLIGNSRAVVRQLYIEGARKERVHLIYNGVTLDIPTNVPPRHIRHSLGISENSLVIIIVANLIHYKGHSDLLAALALIKTTLPCHWRLIIVGRDDGIGDSLKKQAKDLDIQRHVLFLGSRNDARSLMLASNIAVSCSHEEGFSNAILEAMSASLPMVVTDVGGNAEAIVDSVCGYVVNSKDPLGLSLAIQKLADNPSLRSKFGDAARMRVREKFNLDACVREYANMYQRILREKCPKLGG